ncbi:MAG: alpha/beta hydrolase, partial [Hymenobacter sp.]
LRHSSLPSTTGPTARMAPPYKEEEVLFTNFQSRLKMGATFTAPEGLGPFPAVVLLSDLGEQNRDGQAADNPNDFRLLGALADYLTRHGFAVLRFDDRGVGQSEGRNSSTTPVQRAGDAQAALNYLRTRPEVDLLHLGLIGHGEGASIAMLVAAQPLPPAFVVGLGAYGLTGYDTLLQQLEASLRARKLPPAQQELLLKRQSAMLDLVRYSTNLTQTQSIVMNMLRQGDATITPAAAQQVTASLLTPWNRAFLTFNPLESLPAVQCPVLLVSGQLDEQAPPAVHLAELERELKANGNHHVATYHPAGVNHLLEPPQIQWTMLDGEMKPVLAPVVAEVLLQWLTTQVIGKK